MSAQNILQRLLRPMINQKKQKLQIKKYHPKFVKKDYQTLNQQNLELKKSIKLEQQNVVQLKFMVNQYQRKIKCLENIQQKWEECIVKEDQDKKQSIYTQILKKKIQDLSQLYQNAQQKIRILKRLPHVSVFQQSNIQKQYLIRQTARLKAVILSLTKSSTNQNNLQNDFLKLMKQQNQKLKAMTRLLQNQKNILKSRQIQQNRQINQYKTQIQRLQQVIKLKDAQHQTTKNQYKNMIFKKAQQLIKQQQKKQNQQLAILIAQLQQKNNQLKIIKNQKIIMVQSLDKYKNNQRLYQAQRQEWQKQKNKFLNDISKIKRYNQDLKNDLEKEKENKK